MDISNFTLKAEIITLGFMDTRIFLLPYLIMPKIATLLRGPHHNNLF